MNLISKVVISTSLALLPLIGFSDTTSNYNSFKAICLEGVGGKENKIKNVDEYHAYNNKVCECFAEQFKDIDPNTKATPEATTKMKGIMGMCVGQTYLTTIMNKFKNDDSVTVDKILAACDEQNLSISADQTPQDIEVGKKLCVCSANKILILDKDKQANPDILSNIFIDCARQLQNTVND